MTTQLDTFNRADQTDLGTSSGGVAWNTGDVDSGGATSRDDIVSNRAQRAPINTGSSCCSRLETDLSTDDNYTQVSVVQLPDGSDGIGVCCRMSTGAGPSYYLAYVRAGSSVLQLYKNTGSQTFTQLGSSVSITISLPQTIRVEANGTTIKAFWNNVELISVTDSAITSGLRGGIRLGGYSSTVPIVDSFEAGDVGGGGGGGVFVPIIGRGPGMALVGPGGLV